MTANSRGIIRLTETFTASAERVFDAWLSPEKVAQWFLPDPEDQVTRVEIDARVGGSIRVVACRAGRAVEHTGEYLEIQRPHRLSFTIRRSASAKAVRVTVRIEPQGAGCLLTLISAIEPPPLRALASIGALETYRAEKVVRPRWLMRLECKAALSLGLHLVMLPLLPIVLREPELPSGAGSLPTLAMMTVDISTAEGVKLPQPSYALAVVAPGEAPAMAPPPPSAPPAPSEATAAVPEPVVPPRVPAPQTEAPPTPAPPPAPAVQAGRLPPPSAPAPPVTVQQSPAVARPTTHATTSRNTPPSCDRAPRDRRTGLPPTRRRAPICRPRRRSTRWKRRPTRPAGRISRPARSDLSPERPAPEPSVFRLTGDFSGPRAQCI